MIRQRFFARTQAPRGRNSLRRVCGISWSRVVSVKILPRVAISILRMSSRRTPKPLPSMHAMNSNLTCPARWRSSRIFARFNTRDTLSRAVPSSPVFLASMIEAGSISVGTKKSGACSNPGTRSARLVFLNVILAWRVAPRLRFPSRRRPFPTRSRGGLRMAVPGTARTKGPHRAHAVRRRASTTRDHLQCRPSQDGELCLRRQSAPLSKCTRRRRSPWPRGTHQDSVASVLVGQSSTPSD